MANLRLLVVVSGDYGELGGAMYFLDGLAQTVAPTLLVPPALGGAIADSAELSVRTYRDVDELERVIDAVAPDVVMLFSGYLLTFSLFRCLRLIRGLRNRGLTVLTSDPFIGLLDSPTRLDFTHVLDESLSPAQRRIKSLRMGLRHYLLGWGLRNWWHIYPSPIGRLHKDRRFRRALSYFNQPGPAVTGPAIDADVRPSWIFVLSHIDCLLQGRDAAFATHLSARLLDAVRQGRTAVLVAPAHLLADVRERMGTLPQVVLISNEGFHDFMRRLMEAEYAFFWNYYSFSVIHRIIALRPVFFFDEGHMVDILPALHEAGITLFYDGWRPPLLATASPLSEAGLHEGAIDAKRQFEAIAHGLQHCAAPSAVLEKAHSAGRPGR